MAGNTLSLPTSGDEEPWSQFSSTSPDAGEMMRTYTARALRASGSVALRLEMTDPTEGRVAFGLARVAMPYVLTNSEN